MKKNIKIDETILSKLQGLPNSKKAEVLDFVEYLSTRKKEGKKGAEIYSDVSGLIRKKRLKRLSLKEIEAIVHEVRGV